MKIGKKAAVGLLAVAIVGTLIASGALLTYFGKIETTMHVEQSVVLDGLDWDEPVQALIEDAVGGCCYCYEHNVENRGCEGIWLDFEDEVPEGIYAHYYLPEGDCCNHILWELELEVLDGQAEWDDFEVFVDGTLVYSYEAIGGDETWVMHSIDLTSFEIPCCGAHTIKVLCTACEPWQWFAPYGQLAVNYAALYCEPEEDLTLCGGCPPPQPILCDEVDIGNPDSEAGHYMDGWGPIEPATSGGYYGGINDCRVTWFWTDGDDPPSVADAPHAIIELTCEECYDEPSGCPEDCEEGVPMRLPFYLAPDEDIDFCICYKLDMMIAPDDYLITHTLMPTTEPLSE
jgi:hypothetical protein